MEKTSKTNSWGEGGWNSRRAAWKKHQKLIVKGRGVGIVGKN